MTVNASFRPYLSKFPIPGNLMFLGKQVEENKDLQNFPIDLLPLTPTSPLSQVFDLRKVFNLSLKDHKYCELIHKFHIEGLISYHLNIFQIVLVKVLLL